jgi:serine/threonine-protein kinase
MPVSDPAARLNTALDGRYAIERELGEGGMATVYLARDLRHNRNVALKVLKPELAAVVGAERFLAEIETTANLQHPHILPLFDSGEADGFLFYVMPFVEGESLRERLERERQLPVDEAVRITTAVANALQAAHDKGVIHRDIKPANILLSGGEPLIADFGIALAIGAAGGGRLTETGLSLGTPHYMSPEQATGDAHVGPAADIYALACVLYEILTGEPPYTGGTAQAVLGKIIAGELTSATKQRTSVPANVDFAIRKALEKVPADRFRSARDFASALADPGFRYGEAAGAAASATPGPWKALTFTFASLFLLAAGFALWSFLSPEPPSPIARFESPFRDGQAPAGFGVAAFNLSPDGSALVYRGPTESNIIRLWLRRWDDLDASPIRGTEGGAQPAISADGRQLAFVQGDDVKVLDLDGGPVRTVATGGIYPRWGPDGYVYFRAPTGVLRVPATGGPPEPVTELAEGEATHWISDLLPGGEGALMRVGLTGGEAEIRGLNLATGEMTPLTPGAWPRYAATGHLVFLTAVTGGGTLMAAPFDPGAMEITGPAVPIMEGVIQWGPRLRHHYGVYVGKRQGTGVGDARGRHHSRRSRLALQLWSRERGGLGPFAGRWAARATDADRGRLRHLGQGAGRRPPVATHVLRGR